MEIGQPYHLFWEITLRDYAAAVKGAARAEEQKLRLGRVLNQELANLTYFAFHKPKDMPDFTKAKEKPPETEQEGAARLRAALLNFRTYINKARR